MGKYGCNYRCVAIACFLVLLPTALVFVFLNDIFLAIVKQQAVIAPGTEVEKQWIDPDVPVYVYFYFYDLLNPYEVKQGERPAFNEVGPFVYREQRKKFDLQYLGDGQTVQYRMDHYFTPEPTLSIADPLTHLVTTLNVPLAIILGVESHMKSEFERDLINSVIKYSADEHDLFVTKSVDELLWGYNDSIFALAHKFDETLPAQFALQQKNITDDSNLWCRVLTGKGDSTNLGKYEMWHQMVSLPYWGDEAANSINGTEGYFFHPNIKKDEKLYAFIDNLFRSGYFTFNSTSIVQNIDTYRFVIPPYELQNDTVNRDNVAFFMDGPEGLMNMSALSQLHPPIFMSKPHFLDAPQSLVDSVVGLKPDRLQHDSFLDLHPLSGVVLNAHKRMQVNVLIEPKKSRIYDLSALRKTYFPVMYVDEQATLTPELADKFKRQILVPMNAATIVLVALMILTAIGFLSSISVLLYRRHKAKSSSDQDRWRSTASVNTGSPASDETVPLLN